MINNSNIIKNGEPCEHPGCLNHRTHPCENCGRINGIPVGRGVNHSYVLIVKEHPIKKK